MLNLSRREGQRIFVGEGADRVEIVVRELSATRVVLGIDAPKHVLIEREEVRVRRRRLAAESTHDLGGEG